MYPDYNMNNIYYGFNEFDYRGDYSYRNANQLNMYSDEIITLNQAIELIRQSVRNEREDELFYDRLLEQASTDKDKEIITSIRNHSSKFNNVKIEDLYMTNYNDFKLIVIRENNGFSILKLTNKNGEYIFGDCNGIDKIIRVNINNKEGKRLKPEEIELSFYHELCHAIFGEGQYDVTNDEAFVEWSAKCIRSLKQQKVI